MMNTICLVTLCLVVGFHIGKYQSHSDIEVLYKKVGPGYQQGIYRMDAPFIDEYDMCTISDARDKKLSIACKTGITSENSQVNL